MNAGRNFIGFELDPEYHAASLRRIANHTPSANGTDLSGDLLVGQPSSTGSLENLFEG